MRGGIVHYSGEQMSISSIIHTHIHAQLYCFYNLTGTNKMVHIVGVCMCSWVDVEVLKCRTPTSSHLHALTQMPSRIVCMCIREKVHDPKVRIGRPPPVRTYMHNNNNNRNRQHSFIIGVYVCVCVG